MSNAQPKHAAVKRLSNGYRVVRAEHIGWLVLGPSEPGLIEWPVAAFTSSREMLDWLSLLHDMTEGLRHDAD